MITNPRHLALLAALSFTSVYAHGQQQPVTPTDSVAGWVKYKDNPIVTDQYGTLFDLSVLPVDGKYRMWISWRPKNSIVLLEGTDAYHFAGPPKVVLEPKADGWEDVVNRPSVVKREDGYHMWYTAQAKDHSYVGYATSPDGVNWKRASDKPVMTPTGSWEKEAIQCPDVMWDADAKLYKMWYSGGPQVESECMGYATSPDGINWTRYDKNPIMRGDKNLYWESERAVGGHVEKVGDWYYMIYIGFHDIQHAQLGLARSRDGINWERHPKNPIVRLGTGKWDNSSIYRPWAHFDGSKWYLWYGARSEGREQTGLVIHDGIDLGFPKSN